MGTQYKITTNGVDHSTLTYTSKARAIKEGEFISKAADSRAAGDVVEVKTVKTEKVVWTYTAPDNTVTVQGEEPNTWAPEFDRPEATECYFGCGIAPVAVFVDYVGVTNGLCASHRVRVENEGTKTYDIPAPVVNDAQTDTESVSPTLAMVRAIQGGAIPVAGVIQDRPGNVGITHYHSAACADVTREMKRWGQSESDVIRFPFSSVAEIIEFEFSDVENGNWADMMAHATDAIRIMPCLSNLPAGRTDNGPLVIQGGFFREGFDRKPVADDGGFTETLVTKEYHLSVCVDEITGASVDLGWVALTMNTAQAHDSDRIADAYGKAHGKGNPRHGWGSVITVLEVCDI